MRVCTFLTQTIRKSQPFANVLLAQF